MDHGDHGGHGGHEMPSKPQCSMHMLWNTQIEDTCVVFRSWHISSKTAFIFSCIAVIAFGILYESLRRAQSNLDVKIAATLSAQGKGKAAAGVSGGSLEDDSEEAGLLTGLPVNKDRSGTTVPISARLSRALLYGVSVFLSFFLMLVFMTYNAYLILSVVIGAVIGHFIFNPQINVEGILSGASGSGKGMACH